MKAYFSKINSIHLVSGYPFEKTNLSSMIVFRGTIFDHKPTLKPVITEVSVNIDEINAWSATARYLSAYKDTPFEVRFRFVLKTSDEIKIVIKFSSEDDANDLIASFISKTWTETPLRGKTPHTNDTGGNEE